MSDQNHLHLVVLCGGAGTRLWPLSRSAEPKQFLRLPADASLLEQTLARARDYGVTQPPLVICGQEHAALVEAQTRRLGQSGTLVLEPERRNTAPAIAAAAHILLERDPDAVMLVTPADHYIADPSPLGAALRPALAAAAEGGIVAFGIAPRSPATGYGYIELGERVDNGAHRVKRFVEKPSVDVAEEFVASKRFVWNSGVFLFRADAFLSELRLYEPAIADAAAAAVARAKHGAQIRLDAESFRASPDKSIDYAVMERTKNAFVVPVDLGWSDLGSWEAIWDVMDKDEAGNVLQGDVMALDCRDTFLRSDNRLLAAVGVDNLLVIDTPDAVLVAPRDAAGDIKTLVEQLRAKRRPEADTPAMVVRPWGTFQTIHETKGYKVKRLTVNPGSAISLQYHHKRAEFWTIVSGTGVFTLDNEERQVSRGDALHIPVRAHHRLRNEGSELLELVEVQLGDYLGEDDIVRLSDDYGRA